MKNVHVHDIPGHEEKVTVTSWLDEETMVMHAELSVADGAGKVTVEYSDDPQVTAATDAVTVHLNDILREQGRRVAMDMLREMLAKSFR